MRWSLSPRALLAAVLYVCARGLPISKEARQFKARSSPKITMSFSPSDIPPPIYVGAVLGVGLLAGSLQARMYGGEGGLGKFLSDGKGFKKSAYKMPNSDKDPNKPDPGFLAGLRLPDLDFVEVYGGSAAAMEEVVTPLPGDSIERDETSKMASMPVPRIGITAEDEVTLKGRLKGLEKEFDEAVLRSNTSLADELARRMEEIEDLLGEEEYL